MKVNFWRILRLHKNIEFLEIQKRRRVQTVIFPSFLILYGKGPLMNEKAIKVFPRRVT